MAPGNRQKPKSNIGIFKHVTNFCQKYLTYDYFIKLLTDPKKLPIVTVFLLVTEIVLNIIVIERVNYTEIDWKAYMQETEGFLNGTLDYYHLKGDTGPLVYPAGFVYIYSALYFITSQGTNIKVAQYIFLVIYLLQLYLTLKVYIKTQKVPPYALIISILTSYRVHSIYVLRLFNDTIAVLLFYISLNLFLNSRWTLASVFYSLAVSVKMNILLFAPALLFIYLANLGIKDTFKQLTICAFVQLVLGIPFLYGNPIAYIKRSFDLQRVFEHKWTVNYRFLERNLFENKIFHRGLLMLHVLLLAIFLFRMRKYFTSYASLKELEVQIKPQINKKIADERHMKKQKKKAEKVKKDENITNEEKTFLQSFESMLKKSNTKQVKENEQDESDYNVNFDISSQLLILPLFVSNFIGIVCARSLHYQFYVWYFHTLPYLLFFTNYKKPLIFLILSLIELSWNTYPSTNISCTILHICHLLILFGIYKKL